MQEKEKKKKTRGWGLGENLGTVGYIGYGSCRPQGVENSVTNQIWIQTIMESFMMRKKNLLLWVIQMKKKKKMMKKMDL